MSKGRREGVKVRERGRNRKEKIKRGTFVTALVTIFSPPPEVNHTKPTQLGRVPKSRAVSAAQNYLPHAGCDGAGARVPLAASSCPSALCCYKHGVRHRTTDDSILRTGEP